MKNSEDQETVVIKRKRSNSTNTNVSCFFVNVFGVSGAVPRVFILNLRVHVIKGALHLSEVAGQIGIFENRIPLSNQPIREYYILLLWICGKTFWKRPISHSKSPDRPASLGNCKAPLA